MWERGRSEGERKEGGREKGVRERGRETGPAPSSVAGGPRIPPSWPRSSFSVPAASPTPPHTPENKHTRNMSLCK